jgi:uncharacterized membrane protein required for colicin V production
MRNKKGRSESEQIISLIFGIIVLFLFFGTIIQSGIASEIITSLTSTFGFLGFLLGLLILFAIIKAILEAFNKNGFP